MGTLSTGVGLISGIDTATLIDQLIALESRPKIAVQQRVASLQAQQTALLDINARLLNLKNAARSFRINKVFGTTKAVSGNEDVLTATATSAAQPGAYSFIVKQLVSNSQKLTTGYADSTTTPLGLDSLSFEFGNGLLTRDRALADLNAGAGVRRGQISITDRSGAAAAIDLRDATTLDEVLDRINDSTIGITASASGDRLVISDTSGGMGNLIVANAAGSFTATDLGIAGSVAAGTLTGTVINSIGASTALASLNDGNSVIIRQNVPDLRITARDGRVFEISLGRIDAQITGSTELADLNNGAGVHINETDAADLRITTKSGVTVDVNLGQVLDDDDQVVDEAVSTVGELMTRVNDALAADDDLNPGDVVLSISATENRFILTDHTAGASTPQVQGAGPNGSATATDLGLLAADGGSADTDGLVNGIITGELVPNDVQTAAALTLDDVIDRINTALDSTDVVNGGAIVASIAPDGVSLKIDDATAGVGNLFIRGFSAAASQPNAARDLGIYTGEAGVAAASVDGNRLIGALNSVLTSNINGGDGLGGATTLNLTDRQGDTVAIGGLGAYDSLSDLLSAVQSAITAAGNVNITVALNDNGTGLLVSDTSGSTTANLIVDGNAAAALGISTGPAGVAASTKRGANLQLRYVSEAVKLSDLNYGRGIGLGSFSITDGFGRSATVRIGGDSVTLNDVIQEINSRGLNINARINDNGDGLLIEPDYDPVTDGEPFVPLKVVGTGGTTARDLNIIGTSSTVADAVIDGSYERVVDLDTGDTLADVKSKINSAGIPVSASIINAGGGATPFHLNLTSGIGGAGGEMVIDSGAVDLALSTTSQGRDAKVFFGSSDISQAFFVTSSTNQLPGVVEGLTVDLHSVSDDAVTVNVARDVDSIVAGMTGFVTTINDALGRIAQYDFFDADSEERGVLLGNPVAARVRDQLYRTLQRRATGIDGPLQYLSQIGIKPGKNNTVSFDEDRFRAAYENDPAAVEELMASFDSTTATAEEIFPGVTVTSETPTFNKLGFGDLFDQLIEGLTNSTNGVMTLAGRSMQEQIDSGKERIDTLDQRLERRRSVLEAQFAAMESALARIQGQAGALSSLSGSLGLAQSLAVSSARR